MKTYSRLILSLAVVGVSSVALAQETTETTFDVTATVADSCTVSADDLAFGTVDAQEDTDGTSTLTVTCNLDAGYTIALNGGNTLDTAARLMNNDDATEDLSYQLYTDLGRSTVWDDETGTVTGTGDGNAQNHIVYGRIPAQPTTATADSYSDTINVTVSY